MGLGEEEIWVGGFNLKLMEWYFKRCGTVRGGVCDEEGGFESFGGSWGEVEVVGWVEFKHDVIFYHQSSQ